MRSGSSSSASVAGPFVLRATRARVAWISGSPSPGQAGAGGAVGGDRGQALLDVAAVLLEMLGRHALEEAALDGVQVAARTKVVGKAAQLVERPRLEGSDELALVDDARLKREQAEEEMAVGGGGHRRSFG